MNPVAYGIDFGTTNSAISIAYADRVEVVDCYPGRPESELLPSAVYLNRDRQRQCGHEAFRVFAVAGTARTNCSACGLARWNGRDFTTDCRTCKAGHRSCFDARLLMGLKYNLPQPSYSTHSWAQDFRLESLIGVVMTRLKSVADAQAMGTVDKVVIGRPVVFAHADGLDGGSVADKNLSQIARSVGFREVEILQEPVAAALSQPDREGVLMAADFGGGTFDVSILQATTGSRKVLSTAGVAVGGDLLNKRLFRLKVAPALGLSDPALPARLKLAFETLGSALFELATDPSLVKTLRQFKLDNLADITEGGHLFALYQAVEDAKRDLSTRDRTVISLQRRGITSLAIAVTRDDFAHAITADLDEVRAVINQALAEAYVDRRDIELVLSTGGTSQVPAYAAMLEDEFGADRVQTTDVFTSVVRGLGEHARFLWCEKEAPVAATAAIDKPAVAAAPLDTVLVAAPTAFREGIGGEAEELIAGRTDRAKLALRAGVRVGADGALFQELVVPGSGRGHRRPATIDPAAAYHHDLPLEAFVVNGSTNLVLGDGTIGFVADLRLPRKTKVECRTAGCPGFVEHPRAVLCNECLFPFHMVDGRKEYVAWDSADGRAITLARVARRKDALRPLVRATVTSRPGAQQPGSSAQAPSAQRALAVTHVPMPAPPQHSPDKEWWWDTVGWRAAYSPDRRWWWDGLQWVPAQQPPSLHTPQAVTRRQGAVPRPQGRDKTSFWAWLRQLFSKR